MFLPVPYSGSGAPLSRSRHDGVAGHEGERLIAVMKNRRAVQRRRRLLLPQVDDASRLPDFVCVGVQRAGTSWWFELVQAHPDADSSPHGKELHFFDEFWMDEDGNTLAATYASMFAQARGQVIGEWTPPYMLDPRSIPLLASINPKAEILIMLRDPLSRFYSRLAHELAIGYRLGPETVRESFERGLYASQVERVLSHFPRREVLMLQYEACQRRAGQQLRRTFEFLGLAPWNWLRPTMKCVSTVGAGRRQLFLTSFPRPCVVSTV